MAINRPHGLTINDVIEFLSQKQPQITDAFGRIQSVMNDLWRQLSDVSDILDNTDLGDLPNNANVWLNGTGAFSNAQTPWNSAIDGGGFSLSNTATVTATTSVVAPLVSTAHIDSPAGNLLLDTGSNAFDVALGANVVLVRSAGIVRIAGVPVYANNAAAVTGGLGVGDVYRTGANPDPLCIVH